MKYKYKFQLAAALATALHLPAALAQEVAAEGLAGEQPVVEPSPAEKNGATASSAVSTDPVTQYMDAIDRTEAEGSAYDPALSDLYLGLGRLHQERGEFDRAVTAFQRGMQVERINQGLHSIGQTPYLFAIADNESYVGNWKGSQSAMENVYSIAVNNYGEFNEKMLPLLGDLMDWYMQSYQRRDPDEGYGNLVISENIAARMAKIVENEVGLGHPEAANSYQRIAHLHYFIANHLKKHGTPKDSGFTIQAGSTAPAAPQATSQSHFRKGKLAFQKMIQSIEMQPETTIEKKAEAVASLGDWYLVFGQRIAAKQAYQLAYDIVSEDEDGEQKAVSLFSEPRPIEFNLKERRVPLSSVPVTLEVSARGVPAQIEINDSGQTLNNNQKEALVSSLRKKRFRPRIVDGEPQLTESYSYNYAFEPAEVKL